MSRISIYALFLLFGLAPIAFAANMESNAEDFMQKVHAGNLAEIDMGKMVVDKTKNEQVRKFAQQMVDDHTKADKNLTQLAEKYNVKLNDEMMKEHADMRDNLKNFSGMEFDRAFVNGQVQHHKMDIAEFERMSKSANNEDLKNFVDTTLPTLKQHLTMAQDLQATMGRGAMMDDRNMDNSAAMPVTYEGNRSNFESADNRMGERHAHFDNDARFEGRVEGRHHHRHHHHDSAFSRDTGYSVDVSYDCNACEVKTSCDSCNTCSDCGQFEDFMYDNDWRSGETTWSTTQIDELPER